MGVTGSVGCGGRNQQYPSCTVRSSIHLLYVHYCLSVLRNGIPHRFCSRPVVLSTERKLLRWSREFALLSLGIINIRQHHHHLNQTGSDGFRFCSKGSR